MFRWPIDSHKVLSISYVPQIVFSYIMLLSDVTKLGGN